MKLSSFEFSLCLFLLICSRTIVIDRYGVFTAFKEDVYELGVMSKFYHWNEHDFCVSTTVCDLHEVFNRVHTGKIIGQIGHECLTLF